MSDGRTRDDDESGPDAERASLMAKIERSLAQLQAGRGVSHAEVEAMIERRYLAPLGGARACVGAEAGQAHTERATRAGVTDEASRILDAALELPERERAMLTAVLTDSLGDGSTSEEIEAAWSLEINRRIADLDSGRTAPVPWEEVRRDLHAKIERARRRRARAGDRGDAPT